MILDIVRVSIGEDDCEAVKDGDGKEKCACEEGRIMTRGFVE
jgi:hypothetical protein